MKSCRLCICVRVHVFSRIWWHVMSLETVPSFGIVSNYQLNAQLLYSITIYVLHYNLRHVSSGTIFKGTNCIITASGIVTLCKRSYSSGVPRNFFLGGGSTNSVEDRGQRERGSGGSCSLVQEISFHIVKFSQFLVL